MIQQDLEQIQVISQKTGLRLSHASHLASEGFSPEMGFSLEHFEDWVNRGLRSMSAEESEKYGFSVEGKPAGSGLFFPGNGTGQLRCDNPIPDDKGKIRKYLCVPKHKMPDQSIVLAYFPEGAKVVTEGAKDGEAATVHGGIPTGHIYGVSHVCKHLREGAGYTIVFDNDGWSNHFVMNALLKGAKHLNGKVQLIPDVPNEPKAGFCEWFKHLHQEAVEKGINPSDYKKSQYEKLLKGSYTISGLVREWCNRLDRVPEDKLNDAIGVIAKFAAEYFDSIGRETLAKAIKASTKISLSAIRLALQTAHTKHVEDQNKDKAKAEGIEFDESGQIVLTPEQRKKARVKKTYCQEAYGRLFPGNWIFFGKSFYQWTGTHYEEEAIEETIARIHHWCDSAEVIKKDKESNEERYVIEYPYAFPKYVKSIKEWAIQRCSVSAKKVNPTRAFNCIDGILLLEWNKDERRYDRTLVQHDPAYYFLYAPRVIYNYDPANLSDPTAVDRLLDCMEAGEREIVLRTIAASLDVKRVRGKTNRIRALLMHGSGNNGKDTLRGLVYSLFGERMTSVDFSAFKSYDQGNRFACQELVKASVNWPSEIVPTLTLDHIQILKSVISGDRGGLMIEQKGKDGFRIDPNFVNFFNTNKLPRLYGAQDAIASRFAIISFKKTYSMEPTGNKLLADTRFMEEDFVNENMISPFFHKILDALDRAATEGIKYAASDAAFHQARIETDHIVEFADDLGIGYVPNSYLTTEEVMEKLHEWYQEKGYLEVDPISGKKEWFKPAQFNDECVKSANQIWARFAQVFNTVEAFTKKIDGNKTVYWGLGFVDKSPEAQQKAYLTRKEAIGSVDTLEELNELMALIEYQKKQLEAKQQQIQQQIEQQQQHTIVEQDHAVTTTTATSGSGYYYSEEDTGSEDEVELTEDQERLLNMED